MEKNRYVSTVVFTFDTRPDPARPSLPRYSEQDIQRLIERKLREIGMDIGSARVTLIDGRV